MYFFDNGIRNALIPNFSLLAQRQDVGALWENYLMAERRKANSYQCRAVEPYFWRTYDGQEIDLLEKQDGYLAAFEFKWQNRRVRGSFDKAYPGETFEVIHRENYLDFVVLSLLLVDIGQPGHDWNSCHKRSVLVSRMTMPALFLKIYRTIWHF